MANGIVLSLNAVHTSNNVNVHDFLTTITQPLASLPEVDTWIQTWTFSETIHSRSYTHILRNIVSDPAALFDEIVLTPEIMARAEAVGRHYDELIRMNGVLLSGMKFPTEGAKRYFDIQHRKAFLRALVATNSLEAIRFYISFCCTFSFAERELMEGNAKIIKLIARDETLHMAGTAHIINNLVEDDPDFKSIIEESQTEVYDLFFNVVQQEKDWIKYLFKDGSMLGLNEHMLSQYLDYITDNRMKGIGLFPISQQTSNPLTWMTTWLNSDTVQVAPQETEISSYLVGQIDSSLNADDFSDFEI